VVRVIWRSHEIGNLQREGDLNPPLAIARQVGRDRSG
jgi:hypothetical protein